MVLGIVSSDRDIMEPVFIPDGLYLGVNSYMRLLDKHIKPWMDIVANGSPYIFQQNHPGLALPTCLTTGHLTFGLPYHQTIFLYFVYVFLESEVNSRPYNNKEALKATSRDAMINMDRNAIAKACFSFQSHLEKMMAANSDFSTLYTM